MSAPPPPPPSGDEARWRAAGRPGGGTRPARRWRRAGWAAAVALALVVVVVLATRPWAVDATPVPTATVVAATPSATDDAQPDAPTPVPTATAVSPPGADARFDATTAASLLVTRADLEQAVPAAAAGVGRGLEPGTSTWGPPEGAVVEPAECLPAVTVVTSPPVHHDAQSWGNDEMTFEQDVVVLTDADAASDAFRALVTTVDACPRYTRAEPGAASTTWTTEPALEGQGVFPAIVQDVTAVTEGDALPQVTGHALVGNAIVTWTASAPTAADAQAAHAVLGSSAELSAVVESRALAAVRALT